MGLLVKIAFVSMGISLSIHYSIPSKMASGLSTMAKANTVASSILIFGK